MGVPNTTLGGPTLAIGTFSIGTNLREAQNQRPYLCGSKEDQEAHQ